MWWKRGEQEERERGECMYCVLRWTRESKKFRRECVLHHYTGEFVARRLTGNHHAEWLGKLRMKTEQKYLKKPTITKICSIW